MAKVSPLINNFSSGEFGPLASARVDLERYNSSLDTCLNYVPVIQGGITRRPGTKYVATTKSSGAARLEKFIFSRDQAYILEFGNLYVRFYTDGGQIINGTPVEVVTPYTTAQLFEITFAQANDVIYIFHASHEPRKLIRTSDTSWQLTTTVLYDGPYEGIFSDREVTTVRGGFLSLVPTGVTGSVSLFSGAATEPINNVTNDGGRIKLHINFSVDAPGSPSDGPIVVDGDKIWVAGVTGTTEAIGEWSVESVTTTSLILTDSVFVNAYTGGGNIRFAAFRSTDVGRKVRLLQGSVWGFGIITAYTNSYSVTFNIYSTLTSTATKSRWRLGAHSVTTGYPSSGCFHEDRLFMFGPSQYVAGSRTADYENFRPTATDGTVVSSNSVSFQLNSNSSNNAKWIVSDEKGLIAGTDANEWLIRGSTSNDPISPTSISAKEVTSYGSKNVFPVKAGKAVLFTETSGRKLREFNYFYDVDGFRCTDLTQLAHHVLQSGAVQMALQKQPYSLAWACRTDGLLACITYERDVEGLKVGWHRHQIGGVSDAGNTNAKVESVAVIPSTDGTYDELWMVVNRRINGATVRYVERMTKFFEEEDKQVDAFFVDSGLIYDSPKTITAITKANPAVATSAAHGFSNDDQVVFRDVLGMTEVNNNIYTCKNVAANTFELYDSTGTAINSTAFTTYVSGGTARKLVTTISGLTHLEGQTVKMLGDGAFLEDAVVTAGAVTLSNKSATVQIGLNYNSDIKLPRLEAGAQDGTSIGKVRRTHRMGILFHRSLGLKYGQNFTDMTSIEFQDGNDKLDQSPDLFTGIESMEFAADYDRENQICLRQDQPGPSTILAIMPQLATQDRG